MRSFLGCQGLLKMDAQDLVSRLTKNTVILSTAVELGVRWRELAEKLGKLSSAQINRYEAPHQEKSGQVSSQVSRNGNEHLDCFSIN